METAEGPMMVPYVIKRSKRSKRIYLSLDKRNQALLTVPWNAAYKDALLFLGQCGDWLVQNLKNAPKRKTHLEYLRDNPRLSLNGEVWSLKFSFTNRCPYCEYDDADKEVTLFYDPHNVNNERMLLALKKLSKSFLADRLHVLCELKGIEPPARVSVRNQSSRWGSCSHNRGISLNWRLILLKPELQDYVLLHELAHLREMNHLRSFWDLLVSYDSNALKLDKELNRGGKELMGLADD